MMPAAAWAPRLLCKLSQQEGPRMRADFQDRADFGNADRGLVASLGKLIALLDAPDPTFAVGTP
jgi:hypothetical protein